MLFYSFCKGTRGRDYSKISKQQPILFIDADNKKVVHVKFPLCIKLNNKANEVVSLISATYYGYGDYYDNSRKNGTEYLVYTNVLLIRCAVR